MMKKKVMILMVTGICIFAGLTGCKTKRECDGCGETKQCETYEMMGEELYFCGDCAAEFSEGN